MRTESCACWVLNGFRQETRRHAPHDGNGEQVVVGVIRRTRGEPRHGGDAAQPVAAHIAVGVQVREVVVFALAHGATVRRADQAQGAALHVFTGEVPLALERAEVVVDPVGAPDAEAVSNLSKRGREAPIGDGLGDEFEDRALSVRELLHDFLAPRVLDICSSCQAEQVLADTTDHPGGSQRFGAVASRARAEGRIRVPSERVRGDAIRALRAGSPAGPRGHGRDLRGHPARRIRRDTARVHQAHPAGLRAGRGVPAALPRGGARVGQPAPRGHRPGAGLRRGVRVALPGARAGGGAGPAHRHQPPGRGQRPPHHGRGGAPRVRAGGGSRVRSRRHGYRAARAAWCTATSAPATCCSAGTAR
jgi:hypothetical protein